MRSFRHAVVAGGSMAGLLAARALADHFDRVTLIERDTPSSSPAQRKGLPQGAHVHNLLMRGQAELATQFPGLVEELIANGATAIPVETLAWHHGGAWRAIHGSSENSPLAMSRPFLESAVTRRVRALANVTVMNGARLQGFMVGPTGDVAGVRVIGAEGDALEIAADLVVDATGRGSVTPRWLQDHGFEAPAIDRIDAPVTYATAVFRRGTEARAWTQMFVTGAPAKRMGCIAPMEGDRWMISLAALFDEEPPSDLASFLAFADRLPTPEFGAALRGCEPLSAVTRYHFTGSRRQRYDRLARFPDGLIVLGDAVCSFNPLFGQGMTVSAVEAATLGTMVAAEKARGGLRPGFAKRWFKSIRPAVDRAWTNVVVEDFRYPELAALRPARLVPMQWYLGRMHRATHRDAEVTDQLLKVLSFLAPPSSLLRARMMLKILSPMGKAPRDGSHRFVPATRCPTNPEQAAAKRVAA
jgi:2-polyprenyl-6-methoxyphenol hydroxylase-like FAD-dependent oxidoreductase